MKKVICLFVIAILFLNANAQEAVDLGLSVKWASCNVGAKAPEEFGNYFRWGEVTKDLQEKVSYFEEYIWYYPTYRPWLIKYCTDSSMGPIDNLTTLDSTDDAATFCMGEQWRMPTESEMKELIDSCQWEWIVSKGIAGYKVTGRNGNHIFLPSCKSNLGGNSKVNSFKYWTSSLNTSSCEESMILDFNKSFHKLSSGSREKSYAIRAVIRKGHSSQNNINKNERKILATYATGTGAKSSGWITFYDDYTIETYERFFWKSGDYLGPRHLGKWSLNGDKVSIKWDEYDDNNIVGEQLRINRNGQVSDNNEDWSPANIYYPKDYYDRWIAAEQSLPFKYTKREDFIGTWTNNYNRQNDIWTFNANGTTTHECHCDGDKIKFFYWCFNESDTIFGELRYVKAGLFDEHYCTAESGYLEKFGEFDVVGNGEDDNHDLGNPLEIEGDELLSQYCKEIGTFGIYNVIKDSHIIEADSLDHQDFSDEVNGTVLIARGYIVHGDYNGGGDCPLIYDAGPKGYHATDCAIYFPYYIPRDAIEYEEHPECIIDAKLLDYYTLNFEKIKDCTLRNPDIGSQGRLFKVKNHKNKIVSYDDYVNDKINLNTDSLYVFECPEERNIDFPEGAMKYYFFKTNNGYLDFRTCHTYFEIASNNNTLFDNDGEIIRDIEVGERVEGGTPTFHFDSQKHIFIPDNTIWKLYSLSVLKDATLQKSNFQNNKNELHSISDEWSYYSPDYPDGIIPGAILPSKNMELIAFYAKEEFEKWNKGELIVDTNDPINLMIIQDSKYKLGGDDGNCNTYSYEMPIDVVERQTYEMAPLTESYIANNCGKKFVSDEGKELSINKLNFNGHNLMTYKDYNFWKKNYVPDYAYMDIHRNSEGFYVLQDSEGNTIIIPVRHGELQIYRYGNGCEFADMPSCPNYNRHRPYNIGIVFDWYTTETQWKGPAVDANGNLLTNLYPKDGKGDYSSIAFIPSLDAIYYNGTLYYLKES